MNMFCKTMCVMALAAAAGVSAAPTPSSITAQQLNQTQAPVVITLNDTYVIEPVTTLRYSASLGIEARSTEPWNIFEDGQAHLTTAVQKLNQAADTFQQNPSQPAADSLLEGVDDQIDASLGTIFSIGHYASMEMSDSIANYILGPFFQSVADGVETALSSTDSSSGSLAVNLQKLANQGDKYHMDTAKLVKLSAQLHI